MANQDDARRIAMALPGVTAAQQGFAFSVENKGKAKGFIWVWQERIHPKKPRVPNPQVLAARVANETEKAALLGADSDKFFTEPHYNGFPAVLVRLPAVSVGELRQVITEAWRCLAPRDLLAAYDAGDAVPRSRPAAVRPRAASKSRPSAPKPKPARKAATARRTRRAR
jgi:hypothetical protein